MKRIMGFLRIHSHHVLFGLAILSLVALLAWWSVFIHRSIIVQRQFRLDLLTAEMKVVATEFHAATPEGLSPGVLGIDNRFEISPRSGDGPSIRLEDSEFYLHPRAEVLAEIERKNRSLILMWTGESGLLSLIVLACIILLYQNIRMERRTLKEVREFWERAAHEVKTPIAGLKAFLQNLKTQSSGLGPLGGHVDSALRQVERQEKQANNILAGYRMDTGIFKPRLETVDLRKALDEYFNREALHLFEAKVQRRYSNGPEIKARADGAFLRVIFDNITVNAVKYSPSPLVLSVDVMRREGRAEIHFQDNGPGFSPAQAENIFRAYSRLDSELPATPHGTGLGLFISRRLARAMDGDLRASSPGTGQGARLILSLRAVRDGA